MDYKKIITDRESRFKILHKLRFIPDKLMISIQYFVKLRRLPNIKNPKRFTEKIQWYKLYYRDSLLTQVADKYEVRNYIKSKGLEKILVELYGVYNNSFDINYSKLPKEFIVKTNNGSGTNYICKNKDLLDIPKLNKKIDIWLNRNIYASGREWSYKNIKPKVVIEELLTDRKKPTETIKDYKFFCFNGEVKYINLHDGRGADHVRNFYDKDWNFLDIGTHNVKKGQDIYEKPVHFSKMIEIAEKLSEDFPFVRVDLYYVNNKIYFGELTFYPWTGYVQFEPDSFDYEFADDFHLPMN